MLDLDKIISEEEIKEDSKRIRKFHYDIKKTFDDNLNEYVCKFIGENQCSYEQLQILIDFINFIKNKY